MDAEWFGEGAHAHGHGAVLNSVCTDRHATIRLLGKYDTWLQRADSDSPVTTLRLPHRPRAWCIEFRYPRYSLPIGTYTRAIVWSFQTPWKTGVVYWIDGWFISIARVSTPRNTWGLGREPSSHAGGWGREYCSQIWYGCSRYVRWKSTNAGCDAGHVGVGVPKRSSKMGARNRLWAFY
jgi:hypothetical protein